MRKSVWIKADEGLWDEKKLRIESGLESGADGILIDEDDIESVRELGKIKLATFSKETESGADILFVGKNGEGDGTKSLPELDKSTDLDLLSKLPSPKGAYVKIMGKEYERFAVELAKLCDYIIVVGTDWKIIPLENIIAELSDVNVEIIAGVKNAEEAKIALETLEFGADGVLLDTDDLSEIKKTIDVATRVTQPVPLMPARIKKVKPIGMGDRVCVDTCSLLSKGEGMLVGSQSKCLFLVHSESEESPYVAARPFRVNAGAVHAYILVGEKTRYLSELSSGDDVLIVDKGGNQRKEVVGRVKIEKRPLILVEAETKEDIIKTILQNAETIKLVSKDGDPISVTKLGEGDEVLVYCEDTARHFGIAIDETIIEK
jgi:3-dehydroquinate synthase II